MGTFKFNCPHCNGRFECDDEHEGLTQPCQVCGQLITISRCEPTIRNFNRSFRFNCPYCDKPFDCEEIYNGITMPCPGCGKNVRIVKPPEFKVICASCGSKLAVNGTYVGRSFACPICQSRLTIAPPEENETPATKTVLLKTIPPPQRPPAVPKTAPPVSMATSSLFKTSQRVAVQERTSIALRTPTDSKIRVKTSSRSPQPEPGPHISVPRADWDKPPEKSSVGRFFHTLFGRGKNRGK